MRVLLYNKSAGPAQLSVPFARLMLDRGETLTVIHDGPGVAAFEKAGIPVTLKGPDDKVEKSLFRGVYDAITTVVNHDALVLAPNGSPFMSEREFVAAAQVLNIPIVWMEDAWGNSSRIDVIPDLLLVLDDYAAEIAQARRGANVNVVVVGNHAATPVTPSPEAVEFFAGLRKKFEWVFCYLGAGVESTTAEIRLLVESIKLSHLEYDKGFGVHGSMNWCIIPRLHPGYAKQASPSGATWGEMWREKFASLGGRVVFADNLKTEEVAVLSDVIFGGNATDFTKAIVAGKRVISLMPSETRENMKKQNGLDQVPVVALGLALRITRSVEIEQMIVGRMTSNPTKLKTYDPVVAYNAIRYLLKK